MTQVLFSMFFPKKTRTLMGLRLHGVNKWKWVKWEAKLVNRKYPRVTSKNADYIFGELSIFIYFFPD